MAEPIINDPTQEVGYVLQRTGLLAAGKQLAEEAGVFLESLFSSGEASSNLIPAASAFKGVGGMVTIGLAAAVSSGLTQMDYLHRRDNLARLYKEELAAKFDKPADQVKASDLDVLAQENNTIKEELGRSQRQRNWGLGLSFVASMSALAMIKIAIPAMMLGMGLTPFGQLAGAAYVAGMFANMAIGVTTYNAVKKPLHALADKLFGIDEKTTNDYIITMKRHQAQGKVISREEVLAVYVAANPELSNHIIQEYGQHYDKLTPETQHKIATEINNILPLDKMTLDINSHKMHATELAFAVEGQVSGVDHDHHEVAKKRGMLKELWSGMVDVVDLPVKVKTHGLAQAAVTYNVADPAQIFSMIKDTVETQQHNIEKSVKGSFITRLGLSKKESLTHVQQLEQSSSDPGMSLPS